MKDPASPNAGISGHFRREAKWMLWGLGLLPLALVVLAIWLGPLLLKRIDRDQCLGAGGRISQQTGLCERSQATTGRAAP